MTCKRKRKGERNRKYIIVTQRRQDETQQALDKLIHSISKMSGAVGTRPGHDKVMRQERNLQGSSSPRGCPGDPVCPLSLSVLLLLCFLLILEMQYVVIRPPWNSPSLSGIIPQSLDPPCLQVTDSLMRNQEWKVYLDISQILLVGQIDMEGWYVAMELVSVVFHGIGMLMIAPAQDMTIISEPNDLCPSRGYGYGQK